MHIQPFLSSFDSLLMNSNYISPHYHAHKKRLQSDDLEISSFGLPRKKFISEESFAKEMAAMTLDPSKFE